MAFRAYTSGSGSLIIPPFIWVVTIQVFAAGASGGPAAGNNSVSQVGGGGGGGQYTAAQFSVTPGDQLDWTVGAGGISSTSIGAPGGTSEVADHATGGTALLITANGGLPGGPSSNAVVLGAAGLASTAAHLAQGTDFISLIAATAGGNGSAGSTPGPGSGAGGGGGAEGGPGGNASGRTQGSGGPIGTGYAAAGQGGNGFSSPATGPGVDAPSMPGTDIGAGGGGGRKGATSNVPQRGGQGDPGLIVIGWIVPGRVNVIGFDA